ncbi:porin [Jiella marina]|uniref:porin n=1 Tax=Jiella sp. LLJ827 TaxID=2917712 RepID=UPI002100D93D|nr:porin [Jiella sp. LLJ827]MCQ0988848.1 porin [Jiella sp. LLJ827]
MNIKSLLLGSAAALVAVSGARAADVIVPVEPEPMEYVKVCDVYGTGFYYIPGTETCLQISGYVRYKISAFGQLEDDFGNNFIRNGEGDTYQIGSQVRARVNFDAREETEYGTLRAYVRFQGDNVFAGDGNVDVDTAYIQLGGLTMGWLDSLWAEDDGLLTDTDLSVGDLEANRVSYTYASNGFSAALSLEDDATGDWVPNVVGKLKYEGGWGFVYLSGSYDETGDTFVIGSGAVVGVEPGSNDAFALKAGLSLKDLIATDSELKLEGSYAFDPSSYSTIGLFNGFVGGGGAGNLFTLPFNTTITGAAFNGGSLVAAAPVEWQVGAGYAQSFGSLAVGVSGAYGRTFDFFVNGVNVADADYYKVVGNVGYEITNNFDMLAEISYANFDVDPNIAATGNSLDQVAGFVQFVRSF